MNVDLALIDPHVGNLRFNAVADDDLVASIAEQGILTALTVAPSPTDPERFKLLDGHRRFDAAQRAGLADVPVLVRDDLVTEAQQVETMLVTALHRRGLSPIEEAAGYEQLTFFGLDADDIARSVSRPASTVKSRLRLNVLPDDTRGRVHTGDLTLADAEAMLSFADDPATLRVLEDAAGTGNFAYELTQARARRDRVAANARAAAELAAAGWPLVADGGAVPLASYPEELQDPDAHDGHVGYVVADDPASYMPPTLVCTAPGRHLAAVPAPPPVTEWEAAAEDRAASLADREVAASVRRQWLVEHYAGLLPLKGNTRLGKALTALLPRIVGGTVAVSESPAGLGDVPLGSPGHALSTLGRLFAVLAVDALAADPLALDAARLRHQLQLWQWLVDAGYPMSDVDQRDRDQVQSCLDDLAG